MTADLEDENYIWPGYRAVDENGHFVNDRVTCRHREDIMLRGSGAHRLHGRLPQDDGLRGNLPSFPSWRTTMHNRALMGANMQRQAVPLLDTESPIVGTGMEYKAGCGLLSVCVLAKRRRRCHASVSATDVTRNRRQRRGGHLYSSPSLLRSNQSTCINQRPNDQRRRSRGPMGEVIV